MVKKTVLELSKINFLIGIIDIINSGGIIPNIALDFHISS